MAPIEGRELASPAARFRVLGVPSAILGEDVPEPVEFAVFPE
jgi:hypothetical protein